MAVVGLFLILPFTGMAQEYTTGSDNEYFYKRRDTLSVEERKVPVEIVNRLRKDKDFRWLDSNSRLSKSSGLGKEQPRVNKAREYTPVARRPWFQAVLWFIIVGGFAIFLAIYLAGSNIGLFRKKNLLRGTAEDRSDLPEDIFAINYQKEIDSAVEQGNYRLAVRLHFLRLLKIMADRDLIRYKQDKTNLDYLTELGPTSYYNQFFRATRNYEYSWYGLFPVSNETYRSIKKDFEVLEQQLR